MKSGHAPREEVLDLFFMHLLCSSVDSRVLIQPGELFRREQVEQVRLQHVIDDLGVVLL